MGLFRPYEQGTSTGDEASAGSTRRRGRTGATAAPAPRTEAAPVERVADQPVAEPTATVTRPAAPAPTNTTRGPRKKNGPTPTRAQAEAARMERLHPTLSPKEAKRAEREAAREARMRNLTAVDNTPERALLRDHVDARWSLPEFTMPIFGIMLVLLFTVGGRDVRIGSWMNIALTVFIVLMALNVVLVWRSYKKLAVERGLNPRQRGLAMYCLNRMMALRPLRMPRPRIRRGESY